MSIDDDSLICPITQEVFHDPVIAEDGRLYERAAITRWINEHGTSPFTRQVLNVNHLQPDDEMRKRAGQRRRLSVSYNRELDIVHFPPIRSPRNIIPLHRIANIRQTHRPTFRHIRCERSCCAENKSAIFICISVAICVLIPIIVTVAVVTTQKSTTSTSTYPTRYNIPIPPNLCYPLNTSRFKI